MQVIELRNYLLAEGRTADFMRYFEEHFLVSQRDEGMHVLGQFEVVDQPSRFVWIRGFADMPARLRGLSGFYSGAFWLERRAEANSMIREHEDVHLLRPLGSIATLAGGLTLEDRASEPAGVVPPDAGLVVADFYRSEPGGLGGLVEAFERRVGPALTGRGAQVLGHFVAELAPNDYPRLPVIQDPALLVILTAYRDRAHHAALRSDWSDGVPPGLPAAAVAGLCLRPTTRSLIGYRRDRERVPVKPGAAGS
jgi:hypothetical protein